MKINEALNAHHKVMESVTKEEVHKGIRQNKNQPMQQILKPLGAHHIATESARIRRT